MVKVLGPRALGVSTIRFRHGGTFRTSLHAVPLPIRGEEYFVSDPAGFLWWGRLRLAPGVWVDACDRSLAGVGNLHVAAESTVILGDSSGPVMDKGELLRLVGEMLLIPSAFLDCAPAVRCRGPIHRSPPASCAARGCRRLSERADGAGT